MPNRTLKATTALVLFSALPSFAVGEHQEPINIPAQDLAAAIAELGEETGFQIGISDALAAGKTSIAVQGARDPMKALDLMLEGSDLSVQMVGENGAVVTQNFVSQNADEAAFELETIVVQGELIDRSVQDTPTSVVVATGAELERRGDRDIYDLADRTPNVVTGGSEESIAIRGVTQFGTGRGASGPLISTQIDGVALPDVSAIGRMAIPTWDVEQVEILRGPQSTQQGRNALGGAVIVRTIDPQYQDEYRFRAGYGSRDSYEAAIALNKVLIEDRLAFRFAAQKTNDDGWVDNPTLERDDFGSSELESWRAKLRLNPTDNLEIVFSYSDYDTTEGETRIDGGLFPDQRVNAADVPTKNQLSSRIAGFTIGYEIAPGLNLYSESSYYTDDLNELIDQDRGPLDAGFTLGRGDAEVFEQDLRLQFEGDGFSGVAGLFYLDSEFTRTADARLRGPGLPPGTPPLPPGLDVLAGVSSTTRTENFAVFGEIEAAADRWLPGLSFTLGARYDRESVEVRSISTIALDPAIPALQPFIPAPVDDTVDSTFDAFLPKIGASYEWRAGLTTSLTYQRGYRAGGATRNVFTGGISEFDPEFTDNIEFALRGLFLNDRLTVNANVFYTRWNDQQVLVELSGFPNDTAIRNAGESELYGGEFSLDYDATYNLNLYASVGYLHARFKDFQFDASTNLSGNTLPVSPEFSGVIGAMYQFDNGISVGVDAAYTGSYFTNAQNTLQAGNFFLVNAQLNFESGPLLAGLYARNLLDEDYAQSNFVGAVPGTNSVQSGEPRTIGAFVQYSF